MLAMAVRRGRDVVCQEHEEWRTRSDAACWYCTFPFTTVPVYIPISRPSKTERHTYQLTGNFCSFNCAKAYALLHFASSHRECIHYLSILAFLVWHRPKYCRRRAGRPHPSDCSCLDIPHGISLPETPTTLQRFGGTKSIEQYRQGLMVIEKPYWVIMYINNFKGIYVPYEQVKQAAKMIEIKSPLLHIREKAKGNISAFIKTQSHGHCG